MMTVGQQCNYIVYINGSSILGTILDSLLFVILVDVSFDYVYHP